MKFFLKRTTPLPKVKRIQRSIDSVTRRIAVGACDRGHAHYLAVSTTMSEMLEFCAGARFIISCVIVLFTTNQY